MNNLMYNGTRTIATAKHLLLVLVLLISACDGGIFGTGGPDDILDNSMSTIDASAPTSGVATDLDSTANTDDSASDSGSVDGTGGTESTEGSTTDGQTDSADTLSTTLRDDQFTNTLATLDNSDARINVINTSSLSVNVVETSAPAFPALFGTNGVAASTRSSTVTLQLNESSLNIVDNNTRTEVLFGFSMFNAANATFSTLIVRENGAQVNAIALATQTGTSDSTLANVRVMQASAWGDNTVETLFKLQSAGANPGGIDQSFGPLSYDSPNSDYINIPSGDYELIDPAGRITNQMISFVGGHAYTVVLTGSSTNPILLVDDTEASEL